MSKVFTTGVRFNHHLGTHETTTFVCEGVGGALYVIAVAAGLIPLAAVGILFVAAAVALLGLHLGRPDRAWRSPKRVAASWVSRGSVMMGAFLGIASLSVVANYLEALGSVHAPLTAVAVVLAAGVIVYAGMLLRSMKAIRLWRGAFVPASFSLHSLATAAMIVWALAPWLGSDLNRIEWVRQAGIGCLMLCAGSSAWHLLRAERSAGVRASLERLFTGDLRNRFLFGAVVLGIVVPLAGWSGLSLLHAGSEPAPATALFAVLAACRLYGDFTYRQAIVLAGAYEPVIPPTPYRGFKAHPTDGTTLRRA